MSTKSLADITPPNAGRVLTGNVSDILMITVAASDAPPAVVYSPVVAEVQDGAAVLMDRRIPHLARCPIVIGLEDIEQGALQDSLTLPSGDLGVASLRHHNTILWTSR